MNHDRHSVLVVEDEAIVAEDLKQTLESFGYDAFAIAASAEEAIALASNRCPDLVLMDIHIKGARDGIETASILRERFDVPIVFLTSHADESTAQRASNTCPYGYLLKPVRVAELRTAVEIAIIRHQMERQLRARERWFSTTLRSIADAVIAVDQSGRVAFMNHSAEGLIGTSQADALGKPAREVVRLFDAQERELSKTPLEVALEKKATVRLREAELGAPGGPRRTIEDSAAPVVDRGELLGAVMVLRDITDRKLLQRQLELADRLSSLGTMAAAVAHELNNPLTVVTGNAELVRTALSGMVAELERVSPLDAALLASVRNAIEAQVEIEVSAQRIARIVSDLQSFSRPATSTDKRSDVTRAVEWAVRTTAHELKHRARVITHIDEVPAVELEETRLEQVLVNLLLNAAHSMTPEKAGNEVSITARLDAGASRVVIEVRDTGRGMSTEVRERIFEPFFTTKPVGVGTGLGLSICHGIIHSVGGTIDVESEVGRGTAFRIRLPLADATAHSQVSIPRVSDSSHRGRVLVVDDEDMVLRTISRALSPFHEVTCTTKAREALSRLERGETFDVILVDLMMPDLTGMDFYEMVQRRWPEQARRIVLLSGGATTTRASEFLASVPNMRLDKPFNFDALRLLIQALLAESSSEPATGRGTYS